jgi:hypothetical protein
MSKSTDKMTKLVYIGGYGHSGSTLLEYLMTANPEVIACGEIVNARRDWQKTRKCSCGQSAESCPVWGPLFDKSIKADRRNHTGLVLTLLQQLADRYAIIVDSSKTAWTHAVAPFKLRRKLDQNFLLVHILRDPRAVCWSIIKRSKRVGQRRNAILLSVAGASGWTVANLACELFGWFYPAQYHRIRYENLVCSCPDVLESLFRKIPSKKSLCFNHMATNQNRHQLFGNRLRFQKLSLENISEDAAWRTKMPSPHRRLARVFSWGLCNRYGYF